MRTVVLIVVAVALTALVGSMSVWQSGRAAAEREAAELTGGNPSLGKDALRALGCVACHEVPGFAGTKPRAGPPLAGFALRTFVAGTTENTPHNLVQFIRDPRSVAPRSAMPKLPMSEDQARDMAAYLYTLR
jgi:cytochrome c